MIKRLINIRYHNSFIKAKIKSFLCQINEIALKKVHFVSDFMFQWILLTKLTSGATQVGPCYIMSFRWFKSCNSLNWLEVYVPQTTDFSWGSPIVLKLKHMFYFIKIGNFVYIFLAGNKEIRKLKGKTVQLRVCGLNGEVMIPFFLVNENSP